jgi:hypothetical protein
VAEVVTGEQSLALRAVMADPEMGLVPEVAHDPAPWERLDGERAEYHTLFKRYLALGDRRSVPGFAASLLALEGEERPHVLRQRIGALARRFDWEGRARAWDAYEAERDVQALRLGKVRLRQRRRELLDQVAELLGDKIAALKGRSADMAEVTALARMLMEQSRKEYDDTPQQRITEALDPRGRRQIMASEVQRMLVWIANDEDEDGS